MFRIFLSYASPDRDHAKQLAEIFKGLGYSVWWDRTIPPGRIFDEVIQEELNGAKCVVVLWSKTSVASHWVKTEAAEAANRGILVPLLLEDVVPPIEFRRIQAANLAGWDGKVDDLELKNLLASVASLADVSDGGEQAHPAAAPTGEETLNRVNAEGPKPKPASLKHQLRFR